MKKEENFLTKEERMEIAKAYTELRDTIVKANRKAVVRNNGDPIDLWILLLFNFTKVSDFLMREFFDNVTTDRYLTEEEKQKLKKGFLEELKESEMWTKLFHE